MSLRYLPEHAENALLALELARKEAVEMLFHTVTVTVIEAEAVAIRLNKISR